MKSLGQHENKDDIHASDDKFHAVSNFATPENIDQVRFFFGVYGLYCQFIRYYSKIETPITQLLRKCYFHMG